MVTASSDDERRPGRLPLLTAVATCLGLVLLHLREAVFGPGRLFERDVHSLWVPQAEFLARSVASGSWPIWETGFAFGQPIASDPSAQVLYPPAWMGLLLTARAYPTCFGVLHLTWGGVGVFLLSRQLRMSVLAALSAASLWSLSGPTLSLVNLWHHLAGACWLPWVLFTAERAVQSRRATDALLCGVAFSGQVLAGSADVSAMTCALLLARAALPPRRVAVPLLALAGGVGLGLSAGVWLPALVQVAASARAALPFEMSGRWSLHPATLVDLLLLPIQSSKLPLGAAARSSFFEGREPFLNSVYLGAATLPLVVAAALGRQRRLAAVLLAASALALLLALGRHTPLYGLALELAPPLRTFRYPVKLMIPFALAWSLTAGLGIDAWGRRPPSGRTWPLAVGGTALLVAVGASCFAWLAWSRADVLPLLGGLEPWPAVLSATVGRAGAVAVAGSTAALVLAVSRPRGLRWLAPAMAVVAISELAWAHRDLQETVTDAFYDYRPEALDSLAGTGESRVYVRDYLYVRRPITGAAAEASEVSPSPEALNVSPKVAQAVLARSHLVPVVGTLWGLEYAFDSDQRGLYRAELRRLVDFFNNVDDGAAWSRLLRLGNVGHVVTLDEPRPGSGLELVGVHPTIGAKPIRVFRVPEPLPRVHAVGGVRVERDATALRTLISPDFDPRREVVLEAGVPSPPPSSFEGACRVTERSSHRVEIEAELSHDGFVVLAASFDPGWKATVDGEPADVLRANVAFRAVAVPAGRHLVELVYRPRPLLAGVSISAFTLAGVLLVWVRSRAAA